MALPQHEFAFCLFSSAPKQHSPVLSTVCRASFSTVAASAAREDRGEQMLRGRREPVRLHRPHGANACVATTEAIAKLERDAPDVLRALRKITEPALLRDFAL